MYKGASDLAQSRNGRQVVVDAMVAGGRGDIQTTSDEFKSLQAALRNIERRLIDLPPKHPDRKVLGLEKLRLQGLSKEMKARHLVRKKLNPLEINRQFVEVVRERLPKAQFDIFMKVAIERYEAQKTAIEASEVATDPDIAA